MLCVTSGALDDMAIRTGPFITHAALPLGREVATTFLIRTLTTITRCGIDTSTCNTSSSFNLTPQVVSSPTELVYHFLYFLYFKLHLLYFLPLLYNSHSSWKQSLFTLYPDSGVHSLPLLIDPILREIICYKFSSPDFLTH